MNPSDAASLSPSALARAKATAISRRSLLTGLAATAAGSVGWANAAWWGSKAKQSGTGETHHGWLLPGYHPEKAFAGRLPALQDPRMRRNLGRGWKGPVTLVTRISADGKSVDRALMPITGHQIAVRKDAGLAVFGGMNDLHLLSFDPRSLDLVRAAAPHRDGFIFGGHAMFLPGGGTIVTSERVAAGPWRGSARKHHGCYVIRDARTLRPMERFSTHGISPHEMALLDDGRHLAIANYGTINPGDYRGKADIRGGSLTVVELATGRLIDATPASRAEFEVRHVAGHSLDRIIAIQARQAPVEAAGRVREADQTVANQSPSYLPAPPLARNIPKGIAAEVAAREGDCTQGQSIAYDAEHDEFLATFTSSHRILVIDGATRKVKRTIATDALGLRHPRGVALIPGEHAYSVSGSWNGLLVFRRGSHRQLRDRSRLDLVFFDHSHLTAF